jgi:hypothetical protein
MSSSHIDEDEFMAAARSKTRKRLIFVGALCLIALGLTPLPLRISSKDKDSAVSHAIETLFHNRRVFTDKGYARLDDAISVKDKSRVYYQNDLGISEAVFIEHGLKPIPQDRKLDVGSGDVIVSFSNRDISGKPSANIQFSYVFGEVGAQGYEIKIHKSFLMRYFVYIHRWVS